MTELPIALAPEIPQDADAIDKLHRRTFGPGRFTRTAFRLREQAVHDLALSFTAHVGTMMVGSVRLTPIAIGTTPALLLGPLTVEPPFRSVGIGARLMEVCMEAARAAGHTLVVLVGDAPYYSRFGFKHVPPGRIQMPGPVDPARLLVAELRDGAFEGVSGMARGVPGA
ncbi:MAG: N-acetyltransferase [Pseudomonadota bacterium]